MLLMVIMWPQCSAIPECSQKSGELVLFPKEGRGRKKIKKEKTLKERESLTEETERTEVSLVFQLLILCIC